MKRSMNRLMSIIGLLALLFSAFAGWSPARASDTPDPTSVTIAGSLQSELGCTEDWKPDCAGTHLVYDANDNAWQNVFTVPAGAYEYKAALNDSWAENYGAKAVLNGPNIALALASDTAMKFYYDHETHWITDNVNSVIATAPGSFQSELGCSGDWQPDCLRSWLKDIDGDGIYTLITTAVPAGSYEFKVTINEGWAENYGAGGAPGGANIPFTVGGGQTVTIEYNKTSHAITVAVTTPPPPMPTVALVGDMQSELGCLDDWKPDCAASELIWDEGDAAFQKTFTIPAGSWQYKAALNDTWDVNYGLHGTPGGANIPLNLAADTSVKFYFDPESHWITDNVNSKIVTVPGSFQSELGCPGDWQPDCLRSWLQDLDGDGIYTREVTTLPVGAYEAKAAINESWNENYGQGGVPNGANIPFSVAREGTKVKFRYNSASHLLTIITDREPDNNVEWYGLRHDSRDTLYRTPSGAVPAGTEVTFRFRTFHNDVTAVSLRVYDFNASAQKILPMTKAASRVSCAETGLEADFCDYWQATLSEASPNNLWYRFIVTDGSDTDYYADNTPALDGGLGAASDDAVDQSYALMFFDPDFQVPDWMHSAVIYQIFPDRFRDGRADNNPKTGQIRYDDPVLKLAWGTLPEGYCRNYADADGTTCPWRFDTTPPDWSPQKEGPRGRDYFGGDLKGVDQNLDYLKTLGVNTIYFNPIFDSGSNHGYDTQNYLKIDPYFGTQKDWESLVKHANMLGIRIVLDGVFNHLSSDSPIFDRYHHYTEVGACESLTSTYRGWFTFHDVTPGTGTCVGSTGLANGANYDGWFGFDSIPVINKSLPAVQQYFLTGTNSVSKYWLKQGSSGWRLDVMGDASFPDGYWETFRGVVKTAKPDSVIIGELWQKDSTLLRFLRGDRADTTMNYRLRDAVIGLLAPQGFDSKGFADSGRQLLPSEFAARILSIREDYPDAAYYSLMNLLDSHDTERLAWTLTPGSETTAEKVLNAANVAEGKQRVRIASLIQFTMPGAPTIYYGDEAGVTGDDDPDDRRTYPWVDKGGLTDTALLAHYRTISALRGGSDALINGDIRFLLADDTLKTLAYGRKTGSAAAVVVINGSPDPQIIAIPVGGYLPNGVTLNAVYGIGNAAGTPVIVSGGEIVLNLARQSALLLTVTGADLEPTDAPTGLHVTAESHNQVSLSWDAVPGAAGYNVYRSYVTGGGYVKANASPIPAENFNDTGLADGVRYFYAVTALDAAGNESAYSNEVSAMPHLLIDWANLQWPPTITHTISVVDRTGNVYGQVWIDGQTNLPGPTPSLIAQLGFGPANTTPDSSPDWIWVDASFNTDAGSNDEFVASLLPEATGTFDYAYRYSTTAGRDWLYADLDGTGNGYSPVQAGKLTVSSSGDTTAPAVPTGLNVLSASPAGVTLAWDAVTGDASLYGYEVLRSDTAGGPYSAIALTTTTGYTDPAVVLNATYYYAVRSVDLSFNRSAASAEVDATPTLRTVSVVFIVTVPATTEGTGRSVYIAGTLSRLNGGLPDWNPGGVVMTRVDATHWTITLTGSESTQIGYKYTLGDWEHVEKDAACGEIGDRLLTLSYGTDGMQTVNDTVVNWRNVSPCGN